MAYQIAKLVRQCHYLLRNNLSSYILKDSVNHTIYYTKHLRIIWYGIKCKQNYSVKNFKNNVNGQHTDYDLRFKENGRNVNTLIPRYTAALCNAFL